MLLKAHIIILFGFFLKKDKSASHLKAVTVFKENTSNTPTIFINFFFMSETVSITVLMNSCTLLKRKRALNRQVLLLADNQKYFREIFSH